MVAPDCRSRVLRSISSRLGCRVGRPANPGGYRGIRRLEDAMGYLAPARAANCPITTKTNNFLDSRERRLHSI